MKRYLKTTINAEHAEHAEKINHGGNEETEEESTRRRVD